MLSCQSGYDIEGASTLYCLTNGMWNEPIPTCQGKKHLRCINSIYDFISDNHDLWVVSHASSDDPFTGTKYIIHVQVCSLSPYTLHAVSAKATIFLKNIFVLAAISMTTNGVSSTILHSSSTSPAPEPSGESSNDSGSSSIVLIGAVIGGVIFLILFAVVSIILLLLFRNRKRQQKYNIQNPNYQEGPRNVTSESVVTMPVMHKFTCSMKLQLNTINNFLLQKCIQQATSPMKWKWRH